MLPFYRPNASQPSSERLLTPIRNYSQRLLQGIGTDLGSRPHDVASEVFVTRTLTPCKGTKNRKDFKIFSQKRYENKHTAIHAS